MGEVYRARDTRLERTVALKIIRASELSGRDRVDRFKREARAISRLNHPHICTLYDIGEEEGEAFLVMEYVAGETLAARLERGPLRFEEVLRHSVQIAEALDMAHRNGVVHRDLKPSNIMLARGGVKLLDFGLAKLREVDAERMGDATTMSLGLSEDGLILGSLPYMAPEQLEGKPVDARVDIFALGAVLYEMTTGEPPFRGDSKASLIAAILSEEPAPPVRRQPLTPVLFDWTIRRCLAKAPDERWQTAADLAAQLRYTLETLHDEVAVPPVSTRRRAHSVVIAATALATVAALTAAGVVALRPVHLLPTFNRITYRRGVITAARVAPDGQTIVYSASWEGRPYDLYLTQVGSRESRSLALPDARLFGISPSNEMAFMRGRQSVFRAFGTLARVPLAGGEPRELLENVAAADWSPNGSELAVVRSAPDATGKVQVEFPIGQKVYESSSNVGSLRISPDGARVAFMAGQPRSIIVVDRAGRTTTLTAGWNPALGLAWSPAGDEVWFTGSRGAVPAFRAISLDGSERVLAQVTDVMRIQDVFRDGRLLAVRDLGREGFACRATDGSSELDLTWFDGSSLEALSSDGRTVVFGEVRGGGGAAQGIYLRKTDGSPAVRLGDGYPYAFSPDGKWVLTQRFGDKTHLWMLLPVGPGSPRLLPRGNLAAAFEARFLADGSRIVFGGREEGHDSRIYVQDLERGAPRPLSPEGVRTFALATPDGRFVLGSWNRKHMLFPVDGGTPRPVPFLSSEDSPLAWTPDARVLYVLRGSAWSDTTAQIYQIMEAQIDKVDTVTGMRTPWKTIKPADAVGLEGINQVLITPDGNAYCYGYLRSLSDLFVIEGVK